MPTAIHSISSKSSSSSSKKDRVVGFLRDPVSAVSRPVNRAESWVTHDFEMHARNCVYCHDPYEVHRAREQLCDVGHRLAQDVARYIYNRPDGETYSTMEEDYKLVRVEVPAGYEEVRGLLKAIERSIRYRSRTPFVSMDRTYHVAARVPAVQRKPSVKVEQSAKSKPKPRPRCGEIVDWAASPQEVVTEVNSSVNKRGSLYEQDQATQRRNAKNYRVEVREPSRRDLQEHRLSGYYR
ncbi:hypothetical protein BDV95DRAFT_608276 [Massariosphaeria phaeospora]|uniref:Uncharacterized protein n=1 Tax=Massariosphaeria phaeospora TaxID=100035 RepID=A0A7C8I3X6_9PLEO|nr:hypothetical protein BDV95DRAFT_608276 [Massariosphaeria phaeospora]